MFVSACDLKKYPCSSARFLQWLFGSLAFFPSKLAERLPVELRWIGPNRDASHVTLMPVVVWDAGDRSSQMGDGRRLCADCCSLLARPRLFGSAIEGRVPGVAVTVTVQRSPNGLFFCPVKLRSLFMRIVVVVRGRQDLRWA